MPIKEKYANCTMLAVSTANKIYRLLFPSKTQARIDIAKIPTVIMLRMEATNLTKL